MANPDTERLHELFRSVDTFDELLDKLDSERTACELREAVTAAGREVEVANDLYGPFFDDENLGWLLLVLEAHGGETRDDLLEVEF